MSHPPRAGRRVWRDPWTTDRTAPIRRAWLEPLADFLRAQWGVDGSTRLLDVGCGDLQLAELLGDVARIDGVEPNAAARAAASIRLERLGRTGVVRSGLDAVPSCTYDVAVISSVLQYVHTTTDVRLMLSGVAAALRRGATGAVVTDVALPGHRRHADVVATWRFVGRRWGSVVAARWLAASAVRSPGSLATHDAHGLARAAVSVGLESTMIHNLSPFDGRVTFLLTPTTSTGTPG